MVHQGRITEKYLPVLTINVIEDLQINCSYLALAVIFKL